MSCLVSSAVVLLAQGGNGAGGGGAPAILSLMWILPVVVLFYLLIFRPERQRQQQQRSLLGNLKKNDRVVTVGGIYGVVTNVQREQDSVTIKVDEETNTKLRITLGAIQRVLTDESAEKTAKSS